MPELHSLLPAALIAFDVALDQTLESIAVTLPGIHSSSSARLLYLQNVNNHYTVYDEASDTYYNYSLTKRPGDGAELYDMSAQRRLIAIDSDGASSRMITDTIAQERVRLEIDSEGQAALMGADGDTLLAGFRVETRLA